MHGPFVEYLRSLYAEASTTLQVGDRSSDPLQQNRGVRQGDPLSPLLFNCVIDWAVASLDNEMGVRVTKDGPRLNHLAFADDVVLVAESKIGIQHLCDQFRGALRRCGLTLNTKKSKTLRIAVDGKAKKWVCDPTPLVSLAGRKLPTISISQGYKYLGISVSARESDSSPEELLTRGLNHLTRAPLKPQQRVYILTKYLLPKLYHRLVLSRSNCSVLKRLDKLVRRGLRSWLRLPNDAVNSFFHAEIREGGLGVPSFRVSIPLMKSSRLERLSKSNDEAIMALAQSSACFARERVKCFNPPIKIGNFIVTDTNTAKSALAATLHGSVDGRGLSASRTVPSVHSWVTDGTALLTGASYIHAIQIRAGTVATKLRAARGRPDANRRYYTCWRTESIGHVLQVCPRTWGHRIMRHDTVMEKFLQQMEIRGWLVVRAPTIPVKDASPQKPDGVIYKDNICWVIDATIVADNANLTDAYNDKCQKYDTKAIRDWCRSNRPSLDVSCVVLFGALVFNWRGAMAAQSANLGRSLNLPMSFF